MPVDPQKIAARTALILLGAGASRRFGAQDKLGQPLWGRPLAHHALRAHSGLNWAEKILVCSTPAEWHGAFSEAGFNILTNPTADGGMLSSLQLGAKGTGEVSHFCICLADMPLIRPEHLLALLTASGQHPDRIIATESTDYIGVPTILPRQAIDLLPQRGEGGARRLMSGALGVPTPLEDLSDIDTMRDLERLETHQNAQDSSL
ncbi:nucleotidyltransferase family protein [Celeribacter naphthalenivorans]|uniref:nucleotidyltransferase family protein n=1 Tax=Celeribacter naphthalenivorans TaxID=1614694 RepID=UPI001CF9BB7C|nr:NTP transferase domain-containing protein [Celeribacter naphthalenivorans]